MKDILLPENNNSAIKLDPSILKYTNQQLPVAIVAPSKSNHNSLEKRKANSDGYKLFISWTLEILIIIYIFIFLSKINDLLNDS